MPKFEGADQKKNALKRKRAEPCSLALTPEEKQEKINRYRNEIDNLVKFCRDLVLENRGALLENVEKLGDSSAPFNGVIACLMEESDLPLSKLVDDIFEKVKGRNGNVGGSVSKASVKSTVLLIGQRLCYGVTNADADVLEDEADCALWCWETRDLKLIPKLERVGVKVRRTCRRKIHERIMALLAMISALEKSEDHQNSLQELMKATEKLGKVLDEVDIRLLMQTMAQKNGAEMAEKEAKKEEKLLIKQMKKNKREMEKERKKMDRELQKEKLQSENELKRREKEECEIQKQLKRQQEEAEKDQRRKEKEDAELKKRLALQKQASIMERFLKRSKTSPPSQLNSSFNKAATSQPSSTVVERMPEPVTQSMDSVLAQNCGIELETLWKSHLNLWRCVGHSVRSKGNIHWGIRKKPKTELVKELKLTTNKELTYDEDLSTEKFVDGWVKSNVEISQKNVKRIRSKKLLQFDKSHRPAFYGIWPKNSQVVGSRHPFAKDPDIDYEIDSDEEWEEDEPGESLSDCDKDDVDESMEGHLMGDDEDESEDGFFVPDGYLSENEGVQSDEMESDELVERVRKLPDSKNQVHSEEFCTLLRQQNYLNNLTEHALKKNQPLIILNLVHEKTTSLSAEELCGTEKLERMCLQTLSIRPFLGLPNVEISIPNKTVDEDLEASSSKSSTTSVPDSYLPQIITFIQSCPQSIEKIVKSLHDKFPTISKSQLRNKVREISEFSDNRWKVKKEILNKLGLSVSPEKKGGKAKTITTFFVKRCLPPAEKHMNSNETSEKNVSQSQQEYSCENR
ncbi:hypothetical protein ACJIZ3_008668 [Penstemon smallii]|uniref:Chromatin assembly factor 1 subunit FAS1 n=1 Tax=Penstemon smallii TaxID=265156 RepID=A0ABD3TC66_9LAMI